jgi:hypothetical protein
MPATLARALTLDDQTLARKCRQLRLIATELPSALNWAERSELVACEAVAAERGMNPWMTLAAEAAAQEEADDAAK